MKAETLDSLLDLVKSGRMYNPEMEAELVDAHVSALKAEAKAARARTIVEKAKLVFDTYAAMTPADVDRALDEKRLRLPQAYQAKMASWESRNFGSQPPINNAAGAAEELGELSEALLDFFQGAKGVGKLNHIALKSEQGIRGLGDREVARAAAADAVGDVAIFALNFCTKFRLDMWTIFEETAQDVLKRDWNKSRQAAVGQE